MRDELAEVQAQPGTDGRDVAHERLLKICARADRQTRRLCHLGEGRSRLQVHAKADVSDLGDWLLEHQLRHVHEQRIGVPVDRAQPVQAIGRLVEIEIVAERYEGVRLNVPEEVRDRISNGGCLRRGIGRLASLRGGSCRGCRNLRRRNGARRRERECHAQECNVAGFQDSSLPVRVRAGTRGGHS